MLYAIPNPNYTLPKPYPFIITYPIHYATFGFEGRMWDLIVSVPDHCLSFYFGYPDWESVTLCMYQHYPTLDTYLSLSFHSDTLPEYLPYPTNRRKKTLPYIEYLPHLPHPRHLSLHTCTHFTLPFITYPKLHFPPLYYCQGLIQYKAETTYQIRPKRPRTERLRPKWPRPKRLRAEMTRDQNDPRIQLRL